MTILQTLTHRYQLRQINHLEIGHKGDRHKLVIHCQNVSAANALFEDVLPDGITVRVDLLARDLDCSSIEVKVKNQEWLSYDLEDIEAMRQIFF